MIVMQTPDELLYLLYIPRDKRDTYLIPIGAI
jgi:hypothetical protein